MAKQWLMNMCEVVYMTTHEKEMLIRSLQSEVGKMKVEVRLMHHIRENTIWKVKHDAAKQWLKENEPLYKAKVKLLRGLANSGNVSTLIE